MYLICIWIILFVVSPFVVPSDAQQRPMPPVDSVQGPVLYKDYCAVCHGADGKGAGPMAHYLKVKPTDLTTLAQRNHGKFPLARVQKLIAGEEELPAGHGTSAMPVWGPIFSQVAWDRDLGRVRIYNLAKYIGEMQR